MKPLRLLKYWVWFGLIRVIRWCQLQSGILARNVEESMLDHVYRILMLVSS